ncbi:MAG TPA: hypothetical protein VLB76_17010 [Thermoanaerobaculia bacterium]|jgi:hypothetical protein|nr:hypothetical protein [Thermoanaerobaculia bacterium]
MPIPASSKESGLRIRWTLLSAAGLACGLIAAIALGAPIRTVVGMILVTPVLTGIVGAVFGTSQWVLLRRRLASARWWIPASTAGLGLGLTLGVVLVEQIGRLLTGGQVHVATLGSPVRALSLTVVGLVSGAALGAAQWFVLRSRREVARRWFLKSMLALGAALLLASLVTDLLFGGLKSPLGLAGFVLIAGLVAGGVTSKAFVQMSEPAVAA